MGVDGMRTYHYKQSNFFFKSTFKFHNIFVFEGGCVGKSNKDRFVFFKC